MTDYEVTYSFQNIRFTDPADFAGKDTLFTIDDLDLSEDEKYVLIDFMADNRNPGKTDDYFYDYEYWGDNAIFCTTTAYDDDELKSMTEGRQVTSMGATFQDRFLVYAELPDWLQKKVKDYWGARADMLFEWACSVEDMPGDDDDFDYDLDEDYFDIADWGDVNKTAHKRAYSETGKNIPLTSENVKDIIVNCDVEKALDESDEGVINGDDPSYYFTVEAQTPDGETQTIVKDVELSWQDDVNRLQVDIPSDLSDYMISGYDVSASVDESEDEGEDWNDMGDYGYMDHYDYIYDDVHTVITLYLTK